MSKKKEEQGVPWTCDQCDDAHPTFYVHYTLHHGSFDDGKKNFTKLACSEHLAEVIQFAANMQNSPEVRVQNIAQRDLWKRRNFAKHYGSDFNLTPPRRSAELIVETLPEEEQPE